MFQFGSDHLLSVLLSLSYSISNLFFRIFIRYFAFLIISLDS